jgi:uncharacterized protein (TIGR03067 family)
MNASNSTASNTNATRRKIAERPIVLLVALGMCMRAVTLNGASAQSAQPPEGAVRQAAGKVLLDDRSSETGFRTLWNGKDLTGWDGDPKLWSVKDGAITGQSTAENVVRANTFLIWTNGTVSDFELRCSFRLTPNNPQGFANSGIQYRSKVLDPAHWVVGGYQADMEAGTNYTGILYEEQFRGIMAMRGEKATWDNQCKKQVIGSIGKAEDIEAALHKGGWNNYVIIAQGNHLQQFINGKQTVDVTDECKPKAAMSGVLALQMHVGGPFMVQFKDLRLKPLTGHAGGMAEHSSAMVDDLKAMQGAWTVASLESEGTELPEEEISKLVLTIKDNAYTLVKEGEQQDAGHLTVEPSRQPKQMDVRPGNDPEHGRMLPAIYELKGDTFRFCCAIKDADRPTKFATKPDSGHILVVYKRKN